MIGYVTLGTNNFEAAVAFYDALFDAVGIERLWSHGGMAAWGASRSAPSLCVTKPFDQSPATAGNGAMVALRFAGSAEVQSLHARAISLGSQDEGAPGPRGEHGFYGAYFRDLDGNKLCAYVAAPLS